MAPDGVRLDAREEHYTLDDPTLTAVVARLNSMRLEGDGAAPSQGLTRYHLLPEWRPAARNGVCRVSDLSIRTRIVVTLPAWSPVGDPPDEERARWRSILGAIRAHEYAHRDLTVRAAGDLFESLASLEARGCAALRRAFTGALAIAEERLTEAHQGIDRATPRRLVVGVP